MAVAQRPQKRDVRAHSTSCTARPATDLPAGNVWSALPPYDWTPVTGSEGVGFISAPLTHDVVVAGRPAERWGSEVVAIVQLVLGTDPSDEELLGTCQQHIARYKLPKAIIRTAQVQRSPACKADYRWAKQIAAESLASQQDLNQELV